MDHTALGFLGLGSMGSPMARRLLGLGRRLLVFDPRPERVAELAGAGAEAARDELAVAFGAATILLSLRSSDQFVDIARRRLLPAVRSGQTIINLGTARAGDTIKLAGLFADRGVTLIDAPVSGGPGGAAAGTLRIFVGGDPHACEAVRPILARLGERAPWCGPAGRGQLVKGVNQLAMGLRQAAILEAVAYGVRAGVPIAAIDEAVGGGHEAWRREISGQIAALREGQVADCKHAELGYFLDDAELTGARLPLTAALAGFLADRPRERRDNMARPVAAFWEALIDSEV